MVIPAIPATELSGRVYASGGSPISGCHVSAITSNESESSKFVESQVQGGKEQVYEPNRFVQIEITQTSRRPGVGTVRKGRVPAGISIRRIKASATISGARRFRCSVRGIEYSFDTR